MSGQEVDDPERLLLQLKSGSGTALGLLMERYRNYLSLLVRLRVGRRLQGKADLDDLLQEISLEVHRYAPAFRGTSEGEFLAWLRQILSSVVSNQVRRFYGTKCRDPGLERALFDNLDRSSQDLARALIAPYSSPSQQASRREQAVLLADALGRLPEHYREVIILRHLEGLTFPEAARRMGRSEDSVKNVWARALARLRRGMEDAR
jgi:RNA polymerase sigma-70 factor (ECF subfamily)